jgi:SAM-dependent methyltransferase
MKKRKIIILLAILSLVVISLANSQQEGEKSKDQHKRPSPERIYRFEKQEVTVHDFDAQGYILAIGGGGEGVIGQLKGQQVVAIDISKRELEETPPGSLKIIMDARDLRFLDDSFNTAASFFTLCYISESDHEKVFEEVFRVLDSGGRFLIWDVIFLKRVDEKKDIAIVPLLVKLPNKEISTGYGVHWPEKAHDMSYYLQLSEKVGFKVVSKKEKDKWFFLELMKP